MFAWLSHRVFDMDVIRHSGTGNFVSQVKDQGKTVLVSGAAGFLGAALCRRLLQEGYAVIGIDDLNSHYSSALKEKRIDLIKAMPQAETNFEFFCGDITDSPSMNVMFRFHKISYIVNLAAMNGIHRTTVNVLECRKTKVLGLASLLENARKTGCLQHVVYASAADVYGVNGAVSASEKQESDQPDSMYAMTKRTDELLAYTFSSIYGIPATGLRFFGVYGPWGRPDMDPYSAAQAIMDGDPIRLEPGKKDYLYIDDAVDAIMQAMTHIPEANPLPYKIYNIGSGTSTDSREIASMVADLLKKKASFEQAEDIEKGTQLNHQADISAFSAATGFSPKVSLKEGLKLFIDWYREYHKI